MPYYIVVNERSKVVRSGQFKDVDEAFRILKPVSFGEAWEVVCLQIDRPNPPVYKEERIYKFDHEIKTEYGRLVVQIHYLWWDYSVSPDRHTYDVKLIGVWIGKQNLVDDLTYEWQKTFEQLARNDYSAKNE